MSPAPRHAGTVKRTASRAVHEIERRGRAHWRRRVLSLGTDTTIRSAGSTALVIAPHPDDETIGCGATIARKRAAGTEVRVIIATDGSGSHRSDVLDPSALARVRAQEVRDACSHLGLDADDVVSSSHPDGSAAERIDDLEAMIASEVDRFRPAEILVSSAHDWHPDHQACSLAVRRVLADRPVGQRPRLLEYPVWWWVHGPWEADRGGPWAARQPRGFWDGLVAVATAPRADLVATTGHLSAKGRALRSYASQMTNLTGEPDWATLDDDFVSSFFLPHEVSFEIPITE